MSWFVQLVMPDSNAEFLLIILVKLLTRFLELKWYWFITTLVTNNVLWFVLCVCCIWRHITWHSLNDTYQGCKSLIIALSLLQLQGCAQGGWGCYWIPHHQKHFQKYICTAIGNDIPPQILPYCTFKSLEMYPPPQQKRYFLKFKCWYLHAFYS